MTDSEKKWKEIVENARKKGFACKNCNNRVKNSDGNSFVRLCKFTETEVPIDGICERYQTESTEKDSELKKYVDAIYKAEKLLFDAEFELSKVLKDECWMNDEEKGILLDFMKCYLRTKKYNYDNVEVSIMMRLGGCKNADEAKEKYYE